MKVRINEQHLSKIVSESFKKIIENTKQEENGWRINPETKMWEKEEFPYKGQHGNDGYEDVEVFNVLNNNFDGNWHDILMAKLYDKNGECLGRLRDMHFVYDIGKNRFVGI